MNNERFQEGYLLSTLTIEMWIILWYNMLRNMYEGDYGEKYEKGIVKLFRKLKV